jgi:hypothetical protein
MMKASLLALIFALGTLAQAAGAGNASAELTAKMKKAALENALVQSAIAQSAQEVEMKASQCQVSVASAVGDEASGLVGGSLTLKVDCVNGDVGGAQTTISGDYYGGPFYVTSIAVVRAG